MLILLSLGMIVGILLGLGRQLVQNAGILFLEFVYLLPMILIFAWRRISWRHLGFGGFPLRMLASGFGLLILSYLIIIPHNYLLDHLGLGTQGDQILDVFNELQSPIWFILVGAVVAPFVEEIFFRGFLFQGFRQEYGWVNAVLLSSLIFAAAHLDPLSFIPTFVLGCVLAYVYHRSNSLWPGILFHTLVNSFGLLTVYLISRYPNLIPS